MSEGGGTERSLDLMTIIGGIGGTGVICAAHIVEGGYIGQLLQPGAFMIVMLGSMGAVMLHFSGDEIKKSLNDSRELLQPEVVDMEGTVTTVLELAKLARRKGMVAIDREVQGIDDEFMKLAMGMASDGIEPKALKEALHIKRTTIEHEDMIGSHFWEAAGGYTPTVGVLGAVMGLMHVMAHLDDPAKLGAGIAVAFVATIYGVGAANLLFLPMGGKMHSRVHAKLRRLDVIIEGTVSIASGENPMITEQKLNAYLHHPLGGRDGDAGDREAAA